MRPHGGAAGARGGARGEPAEPRLSRAASERGRRPRRRWHAKMLEICLKLVGCKSKKGLSSSSSCYLEGRRRAGAGSGSRRRRGRRPGLPRPCPPARSLLSLPPPTPSLSPRSPAPSFSLSLDRPWALPAERGWESGGGGAGLRARAANPGRARVGLVGGVEGPQLRGFTGESLRKRTPQA